MIQKLAVPRRALIPTNLSPNSQVPRYPNDYNADNDNISWSDVSLGRNVWDWHKNGYAALFEFRSEVESHHCYIE
jgi:hypothetical protein